MCSLNYSDRYNNRGMLQDVALIDKVIFFA